MLSKLICFLALLGTSTTEFEGFIVGGEEASITNWPFIAFVSVYRKTKINGACGGSLISSQTVLTAAHCLDDITDSKKDFDQYIFDVLMGHQDISKATMLRKVRDYVTHEKYNTDNVKYDIGILFLVSPVKFNPTVKKVLLMDKNMAKSMAAKGGLLVGGWGRISTVTNLISTKLKQLYQRLISPYQCSQYMADDREVLDPGVICAGRINDTQFAYSGDSGGPLARIRDQYLAGIVSYRMESHGISIYTSVPYYYQWIKHTQRKLFEEHCGRKK